jgi:hypothetical protein
MPAGKAAFQGSGRRVRATVAPPTTLNRACYWWRNLLKLRTLRPAVLASATGQLRTKLPIPNGMAARTGFQLHQDNDRLPAMAAYRG